MHKGTVKCVVSKLVVLSCVHIMCSSECTLCFCALPGADNHSVVSKSIYEHIHRTRRYFICCSAVCSVHSAVPATRCWTVLTTANCTHIGSVYVCVYVRACALTAGFVRLHDCVLELLLTEPFVARHKTFRVRFRCRWRCPCLSSCSQLCSIRCPFGVLI